MVKDMPNRKSFNTTEEYNAWFRQYWQTRRKKQRKYMREYRKRQKQACG